MLVFFFFFPLCHEASTSEASVGFFFINVCYEASTSKASVFFFFFQHERSECFFFFHVLFCFVLSVTSEASAGFFFFFFFFQHERSEWFFFFMFCFVLFYL